VIDALTPWMFRSWMERSDASTPWMFRSWMERSIRV